MCTCYAMCGGFFADSCGDAGVLYRRAASSDGARESHREHFERGNSTQQTAEMIPEEALYLRDWTVD